MKNNKIATTGMIHFPHMSLSHGEVGMIFFFFYEQKSKDNSIYQDCLLNVSTYENWCNKFFPTKVV